MLVNRANLANIYLNLNASFQMAFDEAPKQWQKFAMLIPSTSELNDYSWVQYFPKMREWIGEKVIKSLSGQNYVIRNKDFEATIAVDRNHIMDDQLGIYRPQAQMAGYSAAQLPDEIVFELLNKGFVNNCYDKKKFFAANHPVGKKAVSNMSALPLAVDTFANARASYGAARVALLNMVDDEGRPLNIMPNVLLVPPALEAEARVLTMADKFKDDDPNPYKGTATVVTDPRLTSATAWFLPRHDEADARADLPGADQAEVRRADRHERRRGAGFGLPEQGVPLLGGVPRQRGLRVLADGLRLDGARSPILQTNGPAGNRGVPPSNDRQGAIFMSTQSQEAQATFNEQLTSVLEAFKSAIGDETAGAAGVAAATGTVETSQAALERARAGHTSAVQIAEHAEAQVAATIASLIGVLQSWTPSRNR